MGMGVTLWSQSVSMQQQNLAVPNDVGTYEALDSTVERSTRCKEITVP